MAATAVMTVAMKEMEAQLERIDFAGGGFVVSEDVLAVARRVARQGYSFADAYQAANVAERALMAARRRQAEHHVREVEERVAAKDMANQWR